MTRPSAGVHGLDEHQREFVKLLKANTGRHRAHEVFRDFCELAALSISNAVDRLHYETREARYMAIVGRYEKAEVDRFPAMLARVVESLEGRFSDCLGQLFMHLELGDHWKGQFFTPYPVSTLMARMIIGDGRELTQGREFFTMNEPAVGAGGMVIALAEAMRDAGLNYQRAMHVTATDVDLTAALMAYIQLSLLHVPAVVIHGNSLVPDRIWDHWVTPAHVLGGWDRRLRARVDDDLSGSADGEPAAMNLEQARGRVVEQRVAKAEQLALF